MLSRGVASLFFLGRLHCFRGEERGSVGDFMPSVVWMGDRASSVVEKSVSLLHVTCLSVSMSLLISGLWGFSDQARTI